MLSVVSTVNLQLPAMPAQLVARKCRPANSTGTLVVGSVGHIRSDATNTCSTPASVSRSRPGVARSAGCGR